MALVINEDKCARCGVCEPECPNEAISQTEDAYVINPALCTECEERYGEPLCEAVCPNDGIQKVKGSLYKKCLSLFG
ncbi:MAG: 4Fe-4S binding protein [Methylobacter sp.]|uniref:4Fe-4S binding protein n=1 Tax=Methylobacter sp. TaxID=2051955 RepID=UPI00271F2144|nr:4Fe-4S binding protein [Methylobacter sp.]MDO9271291.1 4Fe-4S binding protein [Methylobacter sp.]MDP1665375.1 4Fe-4S binding protein [Methylobacter sp.]MDP1969331.1 4Fe-4S binding protein [Methylobacter sp.]